MKGKEIEKYGQETPHFGQIPPVYICIGNTFDGRPSNVYNFFTRQDVFIP